MIDWSECNDRIKDLSFPLNSDSHASYLDGVNAKFDCYKSLIKKLILNNNSLDDSLLKDITDSCKRIIDSINLYHQGKAGDAYSKLFDSKENILEPNLCDYLDKNTYLFRMRISKETLDKNIDMFHIPFDKRSNVESQRYSIAGVPCIYLGSSNFLCWYELNKPNFNNLYSSSFKTKRKLKFLDVSQDLSFIKKSSLTIDKITTSLKFYPIIIACNFRTRTSNAKFNDEYIIPNLLLQKVLLDNSINGIKFMSVKYCNNQYREKLLNYVLPPKVVTNNNHCKELIGFFSVTHPASFPVLMYGPTTGGVVAYQSVEGHDAESALLTIYDQTVFGKTDSITKDLPHFDMPT